MMIDVYKWLKAAEEVFPTNNGLNHNVTLRENVLVLNLSAIGAWRVIRFDKPEEDQNIEPKDYLVKLKMDIHREIHDVSAVKC
jgi:hypothetical protein